MLDWDLLAGVLKLFVEVDGNLHTLGKRSTSYGIKLEFTMVNPTCFLYLDDMGHDIRNTGVLVPISFSL